MADTLRHRAVTVHDGTTYTFARGDVLDSDTPAPVKKWLKDIGALGSSASSDDDSGSASIDVSSASVEELGAHITDAGLTGPATVDLAGGDASLAAKVLEAENLSHGGDGRATVVKPLQKIIDGD